MLMVKSCCTCNDVNIENKRLLSINDSSRKLGRHIVGTIIAPDKYQLLKSSLNKIYRTYITTVRY